MGLTTILAGPHLSGALRPVDGPNPDVVVAYTQAKAIDDQGNVVKVYPGKQHFSDPEPRQRFYEFVLDPHPVVAVFGLMRRDVLGRTRLIGKYAGSDRPLLSELSLLGKFYEVPEHLFFYRFHEAQSWAATSRPRRNRRGMTRAAAARSPFRSGAYCAST